MSEKNIPTCVGVILDGNRRWAREIGKHTVEGHKEGFKKLKNIISWCKEEKIQHLVVYGFSTENWNRSKEEVGYLMDLFRVTLKKHLDSLQKEGVALHVVGEVGLFPEDIQDLIKKINKSSKVGMKGHVWLALSYGGRSEIISAVNKLINNDVKEVTEKDFKNAMWTADMPDPDLIIRTGGEKRLSNFLTWSSVYSELFFVDTYWPAFSRDEFNAVLEEYYEREKRHGK